MTQEEKQLLLVDLSVRLPYGVIVGTTDNDGSLENVWNILWYNTFTEDIKLTHPFEDDDKIIDISEVKPYLFPLSSMTPKQKAELSMLTADSERMFDSTLIEIDFYHKHHVDYRGLIEKGLAIDANGLNIY